MSPHNSLVHREQRKWQDSNVVLINSSLDHNLKHTSSLTEPAWNTHPPAGSTPGLQIWRIENFTVVPIPLTAHGSFYTGDSYIILHTQKIKRRNTAPAEPEQLVHDIFFWLGSETSQDEAGTAAYKTVELDEFLRGAATQHRETQAAPSEAFLALFPHLHILKGGVTSGFRKVSRDDNAPEPITLLRVFTAGKTVLTEEVEAVVSSLDSGDCFILDTNDKIWVWQGKRASPQERATAGIVATNMKEAKHSSVEVTREEEYKAKQILQALGGSGSDTEQARSAPRGIVTSSSSWGPWAFRLARLSDASGTIEFLVVKQGQPIVWADLDGRDVFVVDTGRDLWVWQGASASKNEKVLWLKAAQAYLDKYRPEGLQGPIGKVVEGFESPEFVSVVA